MLRVEAEQVEHLPLARRGPACLGDVVRRFVPVVAGGVLGLAHDASPFRARMVLHGYRVKHSAQAVSRVLIHVVAAQRS